MCSSFQPRRFIFLRLRAGISSSSWQSGFGWRCNVEIQFTNQAGEGETAITLDGDFGPRAWRAMTVVEREPMLVEQRPRLLGAVPRFGSQRQQPDMVRLHIELTHHSRPPVACLLRQ